MDFDKLSRRDFLKKTTVLAVGIAGATMFSGLVNADEEGYYHGCISIEDDGWYFHAGSSSATDKCWKRGVCIDTEGAIIDVNRGEFYCPTYEQNSDAYFRCHDINVYPPMQDHSLNCSVMV